MIQDNPQWHDFPFESGVYALNCEGNLVLAHISNMKNGDWHHRNHGFCYSYPFDPEYFKGKMFGPIKLPKL